jgi:RimJ/RimL family protein N-acetyltransferase
MGALPLGDQVAFRSARFPDPETVLQGERVRLRRPLPEQDAQPLFDASHPPTGDIGIWTYMNDGPYETIEAFAAALAEQAAARGPQFRTIVRLTDELPVGLCSYLEIVPEHGTIEIGNIWFSLSLQRTTEATEGIHLLLSHAFDELGYRRVEWKCNALNARSRAAAERFGFRFEGIFAQHRVVKGRNRDTAWYAITDKRWPDLRDAFRQWLSPANFDDAGNQRLSLRALTGVT